MLAWLMNMGFAGGGAPAAADDAYRFRSNAFNRRRFGGLWYPVILWLLVT